MRVAERIILVELIFVVILPGVWEGLERRGARGEQMLSEMLRVRLWKKISSVIKGCQLFHRSCTIFQRFVLS